MSFLWRAGEGAAGKRQAKRIMELAIEGLRSR
jgi:hypothetical protein